ncbi:MULTISPECIES: AAA family ATPase [unclassified Halobacteriovorax]|uniref:AAA family ATPase n=1 Tax=unclassified Halobacteriovorax TaxID=2639665 RepID=UPI002FEECFFB
MKIVVTGGPGGGKTTALDLFKRELVTAKLAIVPEAASSIFQSGVERDKRPEVVKDIQKMIYDYQVNLEAIYEKQKKDHILLCDRGTLDGLAYWPAGGDEFFDKVKSNYHDELERYDAVIFFETGACSGGDITSNNIYRNETNNQAIELDRKLKEVWSAHPNFYVVSSRDSFMQKINEGIEILKHVVK